MTYITTAGQNSFFSQNSVKIAKLKYFCNRDPRVHYFEQYGVKDAHRAEITK